jgi:hypothetical protein
MVLAVFPFGRIFCGVIRRKKPGFPGLRFAPDPALRTGSVSDPEGLTHPSNPLRFAKCRSPPRQQTRVFNTVTARVTGTGAAVLSLFQAEFLVFGFRDFRGDLFLVFF